MEPAIDWTANEVRLARHRRVGETDRALRKRFSWRYSARMAVASWVMGKKNWKALHSNIIAIAAANPEAVDDLLSEAESARKVK